MTSSFGRDLRSLPNLITLSRIVLILLAAVFYFYGSKAVALVLAVVSGLTDYADGMVARATGQVTRLGEVLDQFSDLCFEALVLLGAIVEGFFPAPLLFIYLFREFWITAIRRYMASVGKNIPSTFIGKLKTNLLCWGFLPTFLAISGKLTFFEPYLTWLAQLGVYAGLVASYVSAVGYTRVFVAAYEAAGPRGSVPLVNPARAEKG